MIREGFIRYKGLDGEKFVEECVQLKESYV